jgi:ABC-type multidrug transport system ATPase subunit
VELALSSANCNSRYKKIIGYVPQDDIVLPELTVRENILHSARIRLPANWTDHEIQHHVDILISCLQLSHVQDSVVGSTAAPVISGGQRKRVSIGMELAAAPMALFLDEPTSGLDATAAASIMATLKALSRLGMTIVTIIHQPRQEIFESLDSLVLLGAGRMIYTGPETSIQPHFEALGFTFPDHTNPADVMGDIIAGEGRHYKPKGDATVEGLINHWATRQKHASSLSLKGPTISMSETNALTATVKLRGAPWYKQIWFCYQRSLVQQYRMKSSFFFELGVGAMAGFLIGLAELNQKGQNFRGIFQDPYEMLSSSIDYSSIPQMALLVGLAIGLTASAPGVKIFGEEKLVYWREAAAGHNRLAYYIGKVVSTIPRMVLANFHFTTLFMLLSTPRIPWFSAFIANLLYFYCIYGLASCVSMVTRREDGPLLAVMSSLIVGVLNGMSPSLKKVRSWHIVWIWRSSPGTWLGEAYFTENVAPLGYLYQIDVAKTSVGYLLNKFRDDLLMLLALGTIYRIVAFLGLRFMWRNKQR